MHGVSACKHYALTTCITAFQAFFYKILEYFPRIPVRNEKEWDAPVEGRKRRGYRKGEEWKIMGQWEEGRFWSSTSQTIPEFIKHEIQFEALLNIRATKVFL